MVLMLTSTYLVVSRKCSYGAHSFAFQFTTYMVSPEATSRTWSHIQLADGLLEISEDQVCFANKLDFLLVDCKCSVLLVQSLRPTKPSLVLSLTSLLLLRTANRVQWIQSLRRKVIKTAQRLWVQMPERHLEKKWQENAEEKISAPWALKMLFQLKRQQSERHAMTSLTSTFKFLAMFQLMTWLWEKYMDWQFHALEFGFTCLSIAQ